MNVGLGSHPNNLQGGFWVANVQKGRIKMERFHCYLLSGEPVIVGDIILSINLNYQTWRPHISCLD